MIERIYRIPNEEYRTISWDDYFDIIEREVFSRRNALRFEESGVIRGVIRPEQENSK